jgi:hypothetical protein
VTEQRCREWQRDQLHDLIELEESQAVA